MDSVFVTRNFLSKSGFKKKNKHKKNSEAGLLYLLTGTSFQVELQG